MLGTVRRAAARAVHPAQLRTIASIRTCAPGFEPVAEAFEKQLQEGSSHGQSFSVVRRGEVSLDLVGGICDHEGTPMTHHTLQLVASATKVAESLSVALMVDRGLIKYTDPLSQHWPALAQRESTRHITLRQLMSHQAGLLALARPAGYPEFFEDEMSALLEEQAPEWVYHPLPTF